MQAIDNPGGDIPFYQDASRRYLIELIGHLSEHSDAIIFLEGPSGSGRSSLLQHINGQVLAETGTRRSNHLKIVDDADQLPAYELERLIKQFPGGGLLLTGLPGSCETIRNRGYLGHNAVERLTIPPFTRSDAEHFLTAYCPPTSRSGKQKILDSCRLFPGELRQAIYDRELTRGGFPRFRLRRLGMWTLIPLAVTLLWLRYTFLPEKPGHRPAPDTPHQDSAQVIRETEAGSPLPGRTLPEIPATETADAETPPVNTPPTVSQAAPPIADHPAAPTEPFSLDRLQLLAANPDHFTLQLMLASNIENTDKLISRLGSKYPHYRYRKTVDKQRIYCLLYGNFATYELAGDALRDLPAEIQQLGPWRRQFVDIQNELQITNPDH